MSLKIGTTGTSYLTRTSPIVTAYPWTVVYWFFHLTAGSRHRLFNCGDTGSGNNFWGVHLEASDFLSAFINSGAGQKNAITTNSPVLNQWNMGAGRFGSATDRDSVLNADFANKGTNVVSNVAPTGLDNTSIGALLINSTFTDAIDYRVANYAVWNVKLTDNELTALNRGAWPREIRRGNLIANWRILGNTSPEQDSAAANQPLTLVGSPTKDNHQGLKFWTPPPPTIIVPPVPSPSGGAILKEAFEYRF